MERKLWRILSLWRTKSKIVFHILFRLLIAIVAISILYASTSIAATCPSTIASSAAIDSEYFYFTGYSYTDNLKPIGGPISTDLYFLYQIYTVYSSVYHTAIRRVDKKGSLIWMASYAIYPSIKSFSMDANEQSVCFASRATTIEVIWLAASTGVITSQKAL